MLSYFQILLMLCCILAVPPCLAQTEEIDGMMPKTTQTKWIAAVANPNALAAQQNIKSLLMPPRKLENLALTPCYVACSALEYYLNLENNYKINLSPDYIYLNLLKTNTSLVDILNFLKEKGTVSAAIVPYGAEKMGNAVFATQSYTIEDYLVLFRKEMKERSKIFETRTALMRGNPVIVELSISQGFIDLPSESRKWDPNTGDTTLRGTHTLLVVGYNDQTKCFELMNSWGFRWGNRGCITISYEDFGKVATTGIVLLP